jgi:NAD-dependent deacetylase
MAAPMADDVSEDQIDELARMVQRAARIVAFTGAGISTESGIPDFRSPGGFWTRFKPIEFADYLASEERRMEAWRRYFIIRDTFGDAKPGRGHQAIARLALMGKLTHVITQNIDDLHRASGLAPECIIELHGNGTYAKCLTCDIRYELEWVRSQIADVGKPPSCTSCGGLIKAATVSFGQPMPQEAMARARAAALDTDLFLAIGSSLQVAPAMGFPVLAKNGGARLVILNRDPTALDDFADLVINGDIGAVMSAVIARLARENESVVRNQPSPAGQSVSSGWSKA